MVWHPVNPVAATATSNSDEEDVSERTVTGIFEDEGTELQEAVGSAYERLMRADPDRWRRVDATRWHTWAVDWTPDGITGYVDGEEWFSGTDPATLPPGPMHLCVQLDFFPTGDAQVRPSRMDVDWVRQYAP